MHRPVDRGLNTLFEVRRQVTDIPAKDLIPALTSEDNLSVTRG